MSKINTMTIHELYELFPKVNKFQGHEIVIMLDYSKYGYYVMKLSNEEIIKKGEDDEVIL